MMCSSFHLVIVAIQDLKFQTLEPHQVTFTSHCAREKPDEEKLPLKDHNPVTAHAPYFDFPTGCRKFKRRDKLYRTFKIRLHRAQ